MANSPSSKKRALQAERRAEINKARRSRMRTFIRKVEEAMASGDAAVAERGAARGAARDHAQRQQRRRAQEHREPEDFAPRRPGERAQRLSAAAPGRSGRIPDCRVSAATGPGFAAAPRRYLCRIGPGKPPSARST